MKMGQGYKGWQKKKKGGGVLDGLDKYFRKWGEKWEKGEKIRDLIQGSLGERGWKSNEDIKKGSWERERPGGY